MRTAPVADQQRVALRIIACIFSLLRHFDQTPVAVLAHARRDPFADDPAARIASQVDHLRTGVGLLAVIRHSHRIELADRIVAGQDAARIFPRQRRTGLDLRPRQPRILTLADTALRHEVIDTAAPLLIAGIPVLHGRIFHFGIFHHDDLHHGRMQLVFIPLGRSAALHVTHVGPFVGHDQRPLELPRPGRIDPEIGRKLHRAVNPLGHITERTVRKDRRIERREKVIGTRHDAAQILADQLRIIADRLGHRTKDNSLFRKGLPESSLHRYGIHHRIDRHAGHDHLLLERYPQLIESSLQLRIDLVQTVQFRFGFRSRVVDNILEINLRQVEVRPTRHRHRLPMPESFQTVFEHPLRFSLFGRDQPHHLLVQTFRDHFGLDVGREAVFVFGTGQFRQYLILFFHVTFPA